MTMEKHRIYQYLGVRASMYHNMQYASENRENLPKGVDKRVGF